MFLAANWAAAKIWRELYLFGDYFFGNGLVLD